MANTAKIGNYQFTLESRGIWISHQAGSQADSVRPFLTFHLQQSGSEPVPFEFRRLYQSATDKAEFHGSYTDRIAFDAVLRASEYGGVRVEFRVGNATEEMNLRVMARLTLNGEADPRWFVPGFFYGNNKPQGCTRMFPAYSDTNRDPRRLVSNHWVFRSDRAALPMAGVWTYGAFTWLLTDGVFGRTKDNYAGVGMSGLYFGAEDGNPALGVEFPYREAPVKFSYCQEDRMEKEEIFLLLPQNVPLIGSFDFGLRDPDLHAYNQVVRAYYGAKIGENQTRAKMAPEWAEHTAHSGLLRWHYDGKTTSIYEAVNFDKPLGKRPANSMMHAGWQSGIMPAYALLWAGREANHVESITAGTAIINKFSSQLSPAGTIFPAWTPENGWSCSYGPEDGAAHSRTVAEAVLFMIRAIALEIGSNTHHPHWCEAVLSSLNYAMGSQREDGAFPSYFDLATGSPKKYDGAGGLPWVAAIAAGASLMQKTHYRDVAIRAAEYYKKYIDSEFIYGSVEDQYLVPTCEDCHWAVISYLLIYEMDRDMKWLILARKAADLAMTWRFSYNVVFSHESMLGRHDFRTRGGDICSTAMPLLGCYGLMSYREFLKLAAYTGDNYYLERAEDARNFATQMIAREEGQLNARAGMAISHVYYTDWLQPKGVIDMRSYAMTAAAIKYAELTRRHINLSRLTYEAARSEQLARELVPQPLMYADVALNEDVGMGGVGQDFGNMPALGAADRMSGMVRRPMDLQGGGLVQGFGNRTPAPRPPSRTPSQAPWANGGAQHPQQPQRPQTGGVPPAPAASGGGDFANRPVAPGQDLLSGISKELNLPKGSPQGRPPSQAPNQSRVSGVQRLPAAPPSNGGGPAGPPSGDAADVSRAMTNTLSSALGLGSSQPRRHQTGDSSLHDGPEQPDPNQSQFGDSQPFQQPTPPPPVRKDSNDQGRNSGDEIKYKIF